MDEKGFQISKVIEYKEDNIETINKFIIIAKDTMLENIKSNKILQFFFDCTYKEVSPSKPKFKLLVLSGFDHEEKKIKIMLSVLYYYIKKKKIYLITFWYIWKKIIVLGHLI